MDLAVSFLPEVPVVLGEGERWKPLSVQDVDNYNAHPLTYEAEQPLDEQKRLADNAAYNFSKERKEVFGALTDRLQEFVSVPGSNEAWLCVALRRDHIRLVVCHRQGRHLTVQQPLLFSQGMEVFAEFIRCQGQTSQEDSVWIETGKVLWDDLEGTSATIIAEEVQVVTLRRPRTDRASTNLQGPRLARPPPLTEADIDEPEVLAPADAAVLDRYDDLEIAAASRVSGAEAVVGNEDFVEDVIASALGATSALTQQSKDVCSAAVLPSALEVKTYAQPPFRL